MKFVKNSSNRDQILISTLNTRTLSNDAYLCEFENALDNIKFDIIGLSEVKRNGEGTIECKKFRLYYNGKTTRSKSPNDEKAASVGIVVHSKWLKNVKICKSISLRVILLILKVNKERSIGIIQAYAPTSKATDKEMDKFYQDVEKAQKEIMNCDWKIVMGDFNSKIGSRLSNECDVMGPSGYGQRNERGERLIRFCRKTELFITNTMFKKKPQQKWTWSLDLVTKNEIDFILTPNKRCVKNIEVLNNFKFETDHRMVRMTFLLDDRIERLSYKHTHRFYVDANDEAKVNRYNKELACLIRNSSKNEDDDVSTKFTKLKTTILTAAKEFKVKPNQLPIISAETREMIRMRENLRREARRDLSKKVEYYNLRKKVKKEVRRDVRNYELERIEHAINSNRCLKVAREGINKKKDVIVSLKDNNGVAQSENEKVNDIATIFYSNLFNTNLSQEVKKKVEPNLDGNEEVPAISLWDVEFALAQMKKNKACGPDDFPIDLLKICNEDVLSELVIIFNEFLKNETLPQDWLETNIVLIFKKGKKDEIKNYRPISLVSHFYKLFVKIILNEINHTLDGEQPPEQAGFRSSFSTSDHLMVVNQLIEKYNEYNKELHLAFIDYEKAFDSVEFAFMLKALTEQGVNKKYVRIIRNIYENSTAYIKTEILGKPIRILKGVKQGDPMSPKIFNSTLELIFSQLKWQSYGLVLNGRRMTNLRFADDVVLVSESKSEILQMIQDLDDASRPFGLKMNREKTKMMSNVISDDYKIKDWMIEKVEEFKYLGQLLSFSNKMSREIDARTSAAWRSFWALKKFLSSPLPMFHKRKLMNSVILPVFTYGAQTWTLTAAHERKLRAEQKAMERKLLKISLLQHISNDEIRKKTKIIDVVKKARELKWNWAGHVQRQDDSRWTKFIENWVPIDGKRSRGHQVKRWRDDIEKIGLGRWRIKAKDRETWKHLGETYVQQD